MRKDILGQFIAQYIDETLSEADKELQGGYDFLEPCLSRNLALPVIPRLPNAKFKQLKFAAETMHQVRQTLAGYIALDEFSQ
ncbi:MAG: hypothetical protein E6Q62_09540 [Nitrosomonas sp.]|nr:MAG: hypothetical protein E6Q62_09540 [Nitrosomonas sp.]